VLYVAKFSSVHELKQFYWPAKLFRNKENLIVPVLCENNHSHDYANAVFVQTFPRKPLGLTLILYLSYNNVFSIECMPYFNYNYHQKYP